jgi:hypothetical protein
MRDVWLIRHGESEGNARARDNFSQGNLSYIAGL